MLLMIIVNYNNVNKILICIYYSIGETVNSFVNDNSRELFDAFMGVLNDPITEVTFKLTNNVLAHISAGIVFGTRP